MCFGCDCEEKEVLYSIIYFHKNSFELSRASCGSGQCLWSQGAASEGTRSSRRKLYWAGPQSKSREHLQDEFGVFLAVMECQLPHLPSRDLEL